VHSPDEPTVALRPFDDEGEVWSAIDRLVVDYARGIDDRDWVLFRTVFADECDVDFRSWSGVAPATIDSDLWVKATRRVLGAFDATQHLMTNLRIGPMERSAEGVPWVVATNEVQAQHWFDGDTMAGFDRPAEPAWCTLGGVFTNRYEARPLDGRWRWTIAGCRFHLRWRTGDESLFALARQHR
jgi:hypothetical protein